MSINNFIKKRPYLVWHVSEYEKLSERAIVEAVLNYGSFDDVLEMFDIIGIKKVAEIFKKDSSKERSNYRPEIKNYFNLYFQKHA